MEGKHRSPSLRRADGDARVRGDAGQALIEYLLMMLMLLGLFTGLYRVLQDQVKNKMFKPAGEAILRSYY